MNIETIRQLPSSWRAQIQDDNLLAPGDHELAWCAGQLQAALDALEQPSGGFALPQLRPIAEMPEQVPEGCERVFFGSLIGSGDTRVQKCHNGAYTHYYADIRLPAAPDAFEVWRTKFFPEMDKQRAREIYDWAKGGANE